LPKDLNGKELAKKIKEELQENITSFTHAFRVTPKLAIVAVGEDLSANVYIKSKQSACKKVGIDSVVFRFPETASLEQIKEHLHELNADKSVHGIILELPLPAHILYDEAVSSIDPAKDVDGLHPVNLGLLFSGKPLFIPSTPRAVIRLIEEYKVPVEGKDVVIVGRSLAVGKPLYTLLLGKNATVTTCHTKTTNLKSHTRRADVIIAAVGKPGVIKADMVKPGAVVIDVGINVTESGLVGDVSYDEVYPVAGLITPVPGGVGPLTVAMILENTLRAAEINVNNFNHHRRLYGVKGSESG